MDKRTPTHNPQPHLQEHDRACPHCGNAASGQPCARCAATASMGPQERFVEVLLDGQPIGAVAVPQPGAGGCDDPLLRATCRRARVDGRCAPGCFGVREHASGDDPGRIS